MSGRATQTRRQAFATALGGVLLNAQLRSPARAQGLAASEVDRLVAQVMDGDSDQPGLAIAVVEDGEVTLARGYGVLRAGSSARCTERTLFPVASNTKAMTAALTARLVETGKAEWDAPLTRYLPEFALSDPAATRLFTVRDLFLHRSGLAQGAGDLMIFPAPKHRSRTEVLAGLRHLPLASGFRSGFAYDNILYVVAGLLIERLTQMTWEAALQQLMLAPLGMDDSAASAATIASSDRAVGHARLGPPVRGLGPLQPLPLSEGFDVAAPAGGVWSSARDMGRWLRAQLSRGRAAGGRPWSDATADELWRPQTVVDASDGATAENPSRAAMTSYAMGWFVQDYRGERLIQHDGLVPGYGSFVGLLPRRRSGIVVLANAEERRVMFPMAFGSLDRLQHRSDFDWIAFGRKADAAGADDLRDAAQHAIVRPIPAAPPPLPLTAFAGTYRDPWYGAVIVRSLADGLEISFDKTKPGVGRLEPWNLATFRTRFPDRTMEDALITFEVRNRRVTGAKAKVLSPLADFSFDYQDLRLTRIG